MCQVWLMSRHRLRLGGEVVCHDFVTFFRTFFFLFFAGSRAAQTDSPIIIVDGSNNPVWCKEVPFVQKCQKKFHLRGTIHQKCGNFPENRHFPAKTKNRSSAITFELMGQTRPNLQGMYRNENSTRWREKTRKKTENQDGGGRHLENQLYVITTVFMVRFCSNFLP
jgi:hypothetical protein